MPTYEYECEECNSRFDYFQKMSDKPLDRCIHCGGKVRKVISGGSGLIFKGSGFYITDYAKKNASQEKRVSDSLKKTSKNEKKDMTPAVSKQKKREKNV